MERVLPAVRASNLHAALSRVHRWVNSGGRGRVGDKDLEAYAWVKSQVETEAKPEFDPIEY